MADSSQPSPVNAIDVDRIATETIAIPIIGTAPLIVNRFPEKARQQMLNAMQGRKTHKEAKDPRAEYEASFHRLKDGTFGFPAIGFKAATVGAARFYPKNQVTMAGLRQFLFFSGEPGTDGMALVRIEGEPEMREDVVRVNRGGSDLRYRGMFPEWSATLIVTYVKAALTQGTVLSLVDGGGLGVGVGEWRPEKSGDFGTYQINEVRGVEVIVKAQEPPVPVKRGGRKR